MTTNKIKNLIYQNAKEELTDLDFIPYEDYRFVKELNDLYQITEFLFLRSKDASLYGCTTASFTIMLGIYYKFLPLLDPNTKFGEGAIPNEYHAHIRGYLMSNFKKKPPKINSPFAKQIWWINPGDSDDDIQKIIIDFKRAIQNTLSEWFSRYSDLKKVYRLFRFGKEVNLGPFGFGAKGSPYRKRLIEAFKNKLNSG